jgi:CBS domain-containing protein
MNIGDICTRDIAVAHRTASLREAAALMRERHVGTLVLTEDLGEGVQVLGVVTDRDIVLGAVARGADVTRTEVGQVATPKVAALPESASVGEAISAMKELGVRRLLVTGPDGRLSGVLSTDDLIGALGHEMAELAHALRKGIEREAAERKPLPAAPLPRIRVPITSYC